MKIKIYCNYGCLSAEKRNVYTYGCPDSTATCWDEMTVEIPEGWEAYENYMGRLVVTAPWGVNYTINDVLSGNEKSCFSACDREGRLRRAFLAKVED